MHHLLLTVDITCTLSALKQNKIGFSTFNLRFDQFFTSSENYESMSGQAIELRCHMSGHVPSKSADYALCRISESVCLLSIMYIYY